MEEYKTRFIEYLLKTGALKVGEDRPLKSKRISPWFVNIGDFNDGESTSALGEFYADSIISSGIKFDLVYGIPDKGIALAVAVSEALNNKNSLLGAYLRTKVRSFTAPHLSEFLE